MNPLTTLAMTLAAMTPGDREKAELIVLVNCVAQVESGMDYAAVGDNGKAVGAWQMHIPAWITANQWRTANGMPTHPRSKWKDRNVQRAMALSYVSWCREQLVKAGVASPSVQQVYVAYGWGFGNFRDAGFDIGKAPARKRDAAERVENLFKELTK